MVAQDNSSLSSSPMAGQETRTWVLWYRYTIGCCSLRVEEECCLFDRLECGWRQSTHASHITSPFLRAHILFFVAQIANGTCACCRVCRLKKRCILENNIKESENISVSAPLRLCTQTTIILSVLDCGDIIHMHHLHFTLYICTTALREPHQESKYQLHQDLKLAHLIYLAFFKMSPSLSPLFYLILLGSDFMYCRFYIYCALHVVSCWCPCVLHFLSFILILSLQSSKFFFFVSQLDFCLCF